MSSKIFSKKTSSTLYIKFIQLCKILQRIFHLLDCIDNENFTIIKNRIANLSWRYAKITCFYFFPRQVYLFSHEGYSPPAPKDRIEKTENPLDDWVVVDDGGIDVDSVDIIMRGNSFNLHDFQCSGRVYAVNAMVLKDPRKQKDEIRHYGDYRVLWEFDLPVVYTCGAITCLEEPMAKEFPILLVEILSHDENGNFVEISPEDVKKVSEYCSRRSDSHIIKMAYKGKCTTIVGSGLVTVVALAKLAKQVNIYGWDYYLEESVKKKTYLEALLFLISSKIHQERFFEMSVIHWLYASRLKKLPHVKIQGRLNDVDHHKKIIENIEKMFYH